MRTSERDDCVGLIVFASTHCSNSISRSSSHSFFLLLPILAFPSFSSSSSPSPSVPLLQEGALDEATVLLTGQPTPSSGISRQTCIRSSIHGTSSPLSLHHPQQPMPHHLRLPSHTSLPLMLRLLKLLHNTLTIPTHTHKHTNTQTHTHYDTQRQTGT